MGTLRNEDNTAQVCAATRSWLQDALILSNLLLNHDPPVLETSCMEVLGVQIEQDGNSDSQIDHRLRQADRIWFGKQSYFLNSYISRSTRINKFYATVIMSFLWDREVGISTLSDAIELMPGKDDD